MLPCDASSAWTDHKNQSAPGTLSPLSLDQRMHNQLSFASSTPNELTMEEASHILDARHARKLLDLEISNKSLLAINATLESSKVKLTKELRELRHNMMVGKTNSEANHEEISAILAKPVLDAAPGGKILHPSELRHDTLDDTPVNATLTEGHLMMRLKDNL